MCVLNKRMAAAIQDLPVEVMVLIFKYLKFTDIGDNCARTCLQWKEYVAQFFIGPHFFKLTRLYNHHLKRYLLKEGWKEDNNSTDLLMKLYEKFLRLPKGKVHNCQSLPSAIFDNSNLHNFFKKSP